MKMVMVFMMWVGLIQYVYGESNVYIVYMGERTHQDLDMVVDSHHQILASVLGSEEEAHNSILYSYKHGFSGFAALLTKSQVQVIEGSPGVVCVMRNRILDVHTTRSWDFLGVDLATMDNVLSRSNLGGNAIIGFLDTGVWPESESFSDHGMGEIPSHWRGVCQIGEKFKHSNCDRKIIGARWYVKGYNAEFGELNTTSNVEFLSPRDAVGHGTHTSSTALGSFVKDANFMGLARGTARGGAPLARLAVYKVCWSTGGCSSADVLAAFDDAIFDGVDVLSVSLGSSPPLSSYVDDVLAVGSFHAVAKGIVVVCSAGNSGPYPQTVINGAPWMLTVGAATIDRAFPTFITLGNNRTLVGQAFYAPKFKRFYSIVYAEDIASSSSDSDKARSCEAESLNATLARGKVVLCFQSRSQRFVNVATKTVAQVKGAGVIYAQSPTKDIFFSQDLPSVQVDFEIGTIILMYIQTSRNAMVKFGPTKTVLGATFSPEIAFFSSRGPSSLSPSILKPDVAAPGVNILASWSPVAASSTSLTEYSPLHFKIESGTSMSCPHVSGIAALLKSVHPHWSPAAIKSAMVTTAKIKDDYGQSITEEGAPNKQADPFDYGGGHVCPNKAVDPGLVYDMDFSDYLSFLCNMGYNDSSVSLMSLQHTTCKKMYIKSMENLNLPSIAIPGLKKPFTVWRTVTNVGLAVSVYSVHVEAPPGVSVSVKPSVLTFNSSVTSMNYAVVFRPLLKVQGRYSFGSISWSDGKHHVRIPLAVRIVVDDFYSDT